MMDFQVHLQPHYSYTSPPLGNDPSVAIIRSFARKSNFVLAGSPGVGLIAAPVDNLETHSLNYVKDKEGNIINLVHIAKIADDELVPITTNDGREIYGLLQCEKQETDKNKKPIEKAQVSFVSFDGDGCLTPVKAPMRILGFKFNEVREVMTYLTLWKEARKALEVGDHEKGRKILRVIQNKMKDSEPVGMVGCRPSAYRKQIIGMSGIGVPAYSDEAWMLPKEFAHAAGSYSYSTGSNVESTGDYSLFDDNDDSSPVPDFEVVCVESKSKKRKPITFGDFPPVGEPMEL
jgi:hypothetical protein